jgi:hypothetical protein
MQFAIRFAAKSGTNNVGAGRGRKLPRQTFQLENQPRHTSTTPHFMPLPKCPEALQHSSRCRRSKTRDGAHDPDSQSIPIAGKSHPLVRPGGSFRPDPAVPRAIARSGGKDGPLAGHPQGLSLTAVSTMAGSSGVGPVGSAEYRERAANPAHGRAGTGHTSALPSPTLAAIETRSRDADAAQQDVAGAMIATRSSRQTVRGQTHRLRHDPIGKAILEGKYYAAIATDA